MKKRHRLTRRAEFDATFKARRAAASPLLVVHLAPNRLGYSRVGLAVPAKLGSAVQRNRVKRRLREAARPLAAAGDGRDVVIVARPRAASASLEELRQSLATLWAQVLPE